MLNFVLFCSGRFYAAPTQNSSYSTKGRFESVCLVLTENKSDKKHMMGYMLLQWSYSGPGIYKGAGFQ